MSDLRPIWWRFPRETIQAFNAFCLYRDLGPSRKVRNLTEEGVGALKRLQRWSKKWKWVARCQAYDDHYEKERTIIFHEARKRAIHAQAKIGGELREMAARGLTVLKPEELAAAEVCKLAETGVKIERLAYGDSTENQSGSQELRFAMASLPSWAEQQVKALDESAAGASVPADPDARPLKASTILALEEAKVG